MNTQERKNFIFTQQRSYTYGTVEHINEQWIFFDAEDDEAFMLHELIEDGMEIFLNNEWVASVLLESGDVLLHTLHQYELNNGDAVRVRKKLPYPYLELLEELSGESFLQFTKLLNSMDISLYDCIYCYNTMQFLEEKVAEKRGVNFLVYDNESVICSVQHHFTRGKQNSDRFEYTLQTGKRMLYTNLDRKAK